MDASPYESPEAEPDAEEELPSIRWNVSSVFGLMMLLTCIFPAAVVLSIFAVFLVRLAMFVMTAPGSSP